MTIKSKKCPKCKQTIGYIKFVCDYCGKESPCDAITISFGYGSKNDGDYDKHFCNEDCAKNWLGGKKYKGDDFKNIT